ASRADWPSRPVTDSRCREGVTSRHSNRDGNVVAGGSVLEFGIPALIEIPDDAGLADVVFSRGAADPDEVMVQRGRAEGGWQDVTSAAFRDEVSALAKGLIAAGIEPGDRVALMSRTRYEWTVADYAIWAAGAVSVPVYETSSAEQVEWIIGDSGARAA